ncbi:MAG: porin [Planctomycetota bacterium]|nr:porin [Planctomycetota bacterium]
MHIAPRQVVVALASLMFISTFATAQSEWELARREEIRIWIDALLSDADSRSSLLGQGLNAGWDKHFFIQSADGDYRLEFSGQMQTQYLYNHQDDSIDDDSRGGFQTRRLKLTFDGHLIDPSIQYKASIDIKGSKQRGSDAYITKTFENNLRLRVGQFKPPFLYEVLISSKRQLTVDRSLIANQRDFDQNRTLGIELGSTGERMKWAIMYHQGFDTDRTSALDEDTEYAATGRVDFLLAGTWRQLGDFTSWRGDPFAARIGAAFAIEEDEYGTSTGPEVRRLGWTIDGSLEFGGSNLFGAIMGIHVSADGLPDHDRYACIVQGGHFVSDDIEIFARYEWADLDESGVENLNLLTLGFNRYFSKHSLKWTTDVGYSFNAIDPLLAVDSVGWREDSPGEDGQILIRTQFQLLF